jgi:hypothetical protein
MAMQPEMVTLSCIGVLEVANVWSQLQTHSDMTLAVSILQAS